MLADLTACLEKDIHDTAHSNYIILNGLVEVAFLYPDENTRSSCKCGRENINMKMRITR